MTFQLLGTLFDRAPTAVTVAGFVALCLSWLSLCGALLRDKYLRGDFPQ